MSWWKISSSFVYSAAVYSAAPASKVASPSYDDSCITSTFLWHILIEPFARKWGRPRWGNRVKISVPYSLHRQFQVYSLDSQLSQQHQLTRPFPSLICLSTWNYQAFFLFPKPSDSILAVVMGVYGCTNLRGCCSVYLWNFNSIYFFLVKKMDVKRSSVEIKWGRETIVRIKVCKRKK